jgi:ATP-dependent DNA helicase RecG
LGGRFFFGVSDDGGAIGLADVKTTSGNISRLIKERISPLPDFSLEPQRVDGGKDILILKISSGEIPPYYYVGDGNTTAYIRVGSESNPASPKG